MTKELEHNQRSAQRRRLRQTAFGLLALEGIALGLKAWEERRADDADALAGLQREALAVSERLKGRTDAARA
ncbi:MAG: hypothetical protein AAFQ67_08355, partial [Pseudomonadota bacterium]